MPSLLYSTLFCVLGGTKRLPRPLASSWDPKVRGWREVRVFILWAPFLVSPMGALCTSAENFCQEDDFWNHRKLPLLALLGWWTTISGFPLPYPAEELHHSLLASLKPPHTFLVNSLSLNFPQFLCLTLPSASCWDPAWCSTLLKYVSFPPLLFFI